MADVSNRKFIAPIIAGLALLITAAVWIGLPHASLQQAPDIALHIIDGRSIDLQKLHGRPTVVTFWATSCAICIEKVPALKALYRSLNPRGLELIAVAMAYDPPNRILAFSKKNNIPYPIALDIDGAAARAFDDVALTPTTFLIAPGGKIVFSKTGSFNIDDLRKKIVELLPAEKPVARNETSLLPVI